MTLPDLPPDLLQYRLIGPDAVTHLFNGAADSHGVQWLMKSLDGWDTPAVRIDTAPRVQGHGLFAGSFFYDGRPLTAAGYLHSPTGVAALRLALADLLGAVDTPGSFCTVLVDETPARQVRAKRAGNVGIIKHGKSLLEFDIPLLAPDPRRYAQTLTTVTAITTGSGTAVTPGGNFRDGTPTVLTLTPTSGSMTLAELTTGSSWVISGTRPVVFDGAAHTVTFGDDGSPAYSAVTSATTFFPLMLPGVTYQFKRTGGSSATVAYRDAWV